MKKILLILLATFIIGMTLIPIISAAKEPVDVDRDCLIKMCGIPWGISESEARRKDLYPLDEKVWFKVGNPLTKYPGLVPGGGLPGGITFGKENITIIFDPRNGFTKCIIAWNATGQEAQRIVHGLRYYFGIVYSLPANLPNDKSMEKGRWLLDSKGRLTTDERKTVLMIGVDRDLKKDKVYLIYTRW